MTLILDRYLTGPIALRLVPTIMVDLTHNRRTV
jgi:hypothetical protein